MKLSPLHKGKSVAEWHRIVDERATRLVRIHVAGRKPIPDRAKRSAAHQRRDRAFDRLITAVLDRDIAIDLAQQDFDRWMKRSSAAKRGHANRRSR